MDTDVDPSIAPARVGSAATVVLLRDGERGLELLLAERPSDRGSYRGAWVFPGGAVDEADAAGDPPDSEAAARRAAVRETLEETGLTVDPGELVLFSLWTPPQGAEKRLHTRFFAARMPDGVIRLAPDEFVAAEWIRPVDALERHAAGAMTLYPPTWVTLHELAGAASAADALAALRGGEVHAYVGRFTGDRTALYWQEDEHFAADRDDATAPDDGPDDGPDEGPDAQGPRHRLLMDRLPWVYLNSF
jgi:8-oxo-dGTP pyrophosphatase MutT (NUDIX family)